MSTKIQQPTPNQLVVTQDADGLTQLFGVLITLPGLYLYYHLVLALYEYGAALMRSEAGVLGLLLRSLPGILLTLIFGGVFVVLGVVGFSWSKVTIDRQAQTMSKVRHFGLYQSKKVHPLMNFSQVEIDFATPLTSKEKLDRFEIRLLAPKGKAIEIATIRWREVDAAIAISKQIAEFLGYQFSSQIEDWLNPNVKTEPNPSWMSGWWTHELQILRSVVQWIQKLAG